MDHQVIKQKLHQWQATDINVSALGDLRSIGSPRSLKFVGERKLIRMKILPNHMAWRALVDQFLTRLEQPELTDNVKRVCGGSEQTKA